MKIRALLMIVLLPAVLGCRMVTECSTDGSCHTSEVSDSGNPTFWWETVKIPSGYEAGYPVFYQCDKDGVKISAMDTTAAVGNDLNYSGSERSYSVRLKNDDQCKEPCGYIQALLCPMEKQNCEKKDAIKDLGLGSVSGWEMTF